MSQIVELDRTKIAAFTKHEAAIAEMAAQYMPLTINGIDDKAGFKAVHEARMVVKGKRVEVEKRRKELKADALEYGKLVDSAAKSLTALLEPIESHLQAEEDAITEAKEKIKREKAEAEAKRLQARLDQLIAVESRLPAASVQVMSDEEFATTLNEAKRAFAERQEKAKAEAEAARQEAIRMAAEREALEAERKRLADIEKQQQAEAAKQKAEADRIAAENARIEREKREAEHRAEVERERAAAAERAKVETEARLKREAEEAARKAAEKKAADEAVRARLEKLRPDREKLIAYVDAIAAIRLAEVSTNSAMFGASVQREVANLCESIRSRIDKACPAFTLDDL
jgi:DNA repair exonuclease SbcCD ATPase subunit